MPQDDQDDLSSEERKSTARFSGPSLVVPLLILAIIAGYLYLLGSSPRKISYKFFLEQLRAKNVAEVDLFTRYAVGKFKHPVTPDGEGKREDGTAKRDGETSAEPAAEIKKSTSTKAVAKAEAKPDLRFMVTLPDRFAESEDFG